MYTKRGGQNPICDKTPHYLDLLDNPVGYLASRFLTLAGESLARRKPKLPNNFFL
jgi:hypothetical protein